MVDLVPTALPAMVHNAEDSEFSHLPEEAFRYSNGVYSIRECRKVLTVPQQNPSVAETMFADETKRYLELRPGLAEKLQRIEKLYKIFGEYLNLTQSRIIVRESGASTTEADLSATLLRTDR